MNENVSYVSGNIAAGKSTIISHIASTYPSSLVHVHREPVDSWMNIQGFDLLKALYTDSRRWTFAFEMNALLSRIKNHGKAMSNTLNIYERSILSCFHVFIRHDRKEKYLNEMEYRILQEHFEYGLTRTMDLSSTVILYLDLPPKDCFERIVQRSRHSELTVDLKRLEQLNDHYDAFIRNFHLCPIKIIDASQSIEQISKQVDRVLNPLLQQDGVSHMAPTIDGL